MLACDDQTTDPGLARPAVRERRVRHRTESIERWTEQPDHLPPGIEAEDRIGIADPLRLGDLGKWRRVGRRQPQVEWTTGRRTMLAGRSSQRPHRPAVHP